MLIHISLQSFQKLYLPPWSHSPSLLLRGNHCLDLGVCGAVEAQYIHLPQLSFVSSLQPETIRNTVFGCAGFITYCCEGGHTLESHGASQ